MRMEECEVLHEINLRNSWSCLSMLKIKIFTQFLSWTSSGNIEEWQTLVSLFLWCFCSQTHRYIMSIRRIHSTSHHRAESFVVSFWYFYICYCLMLSQCNSFEQYVIKLNMTFVVQCAICYKSDGCPQVFSVVLDEDRIWLFLGILLSCYMYMLCIELLPLGAWVVV